LPRKIKRRATCSQQYKRSATKSAVSRVLLFSASRSVPLDSTTDWASWALCASPECDPQLGELGFKNGRLNFVLKRWAQTETASEVIVALYGVIRDIEQRNLGPCRPGARDDVFYPGQEVKQVELVCGEHMLIRIVQTHSAYPPFPVEVNQELWAEIPKGANFAGK